MRQLDSSAALIHAAGTNGTNGQDATRPAGPCFDDTHRYVDCGNGTVTDMVTGLIWLKQADCLGAARYAAANQAAAGLKNGDCGLTDGSSPGDWRLPTKEEWVATKAAAADLGCTLGGSGGPTLTNDAGTACFNSGPSSFAGVAPVIHWSNSSLDVNPLYGWTASFNFGGIGTSDKNRDFAIWPVRGGAR